MCFKNICNTCGKIGWIGCGVHVERIKKEVPENERCMHCKWD